MPEELAFAAVPVVVIGFIVLVTVMMVAVILSRVIRLARGGPAADRLRQQLAQQSHMQLHDGHTAAMHAHQAFVDMQQQQTAIDIANSTAAAGNSSNNSVPPG